VGLSMKETIICECEAIKTGFRQTKDGDFITFKIDKTPDNDISGLIDIDLGDIVILKVTKQDTGI
jgi:hypothetical protein